MGYNLVVTECFLPKPGASILLTAPNAAAGPGVAASAGPARAAPRGAAGVAGAGPQEVTRIQLPYYLLLLSVCIPIL